MIDIFIPSRIGNYYLIPQRILAVDINKSQVHAAQVSYSGKRIVIEKLMHEPIDTDSNKTSEERITDAIGRIVRRADKHTAVRTPISNPAITIKELQMPFADYEKIKMVVPFEIEAALPFSLSDAVIDMIVTHCTSNGEGASILAAATKKSVVQEHLAYFKAAGIEPEAITIDVFDLYGLYMMIPSYRALQGTVMLIDIGYQITRILLIVDQQLKLVRIIQQGIVTVTKSVASSLNISAPQAFEEVIRFGFEKHDGQGYQDAVSQASSEFWKTIKFTADSFATQLPAARSVDHILICGSGSEIAGMKEFASKFLNKDVKQFEPHELFKDKNITMNHGQRIDQSSLLALACALPNPITRDVNLRQAELALSTTWQFAKQFIAGAILLFLLLSSFIGFVWWQTRTVAKAVRASEIEAVRELNSQDLSDASSLTTALEQAEEKVTAEEDLWFGFSRQARFSFLQTLQSLSAAIDKQATGLNLKRLLITANSLVFEGEVKDFNALKTLERELRESALFVFVPTLQELKINEKLFFKKNGEAA